MAAFLSILAAITVILVFLAPGLGWTLNAPGDGLDVDEEDFPDLDRGRGRRTGSARDWYRDLDRDGEESDRKEAGRRPAASFAESDDEVEFVEELLDDDGEDDQAEADARLIAPVRPPRIPASGALLLFARVDGARADALAETLRSRGVKVRLEPPEEGEDALREAAPGLIEAAEVALVLWTPASLTSKRVLNEAEVARLEDKLVHVQLEPVDPPGWMPAGAAVDLSSWSPGRDGPAVSRLVSAIDSLRARRALAAPAAPPEDMTSFARPKRRSIYDAAPAREPREAREHAPTRNGAGRPRRRAPATNGAHYDGADLRRAADEIDATAIAPVSVRKGRPFAIRVILHKTEDFERAVADAREVMTDKRNGHAGPRVEVRIHAPGVETDEPIRGLVWNGEPAALVFGARAKDTSARRLDLTARVFVDGLPFGSIRVPIDLAGKREADEGKRVRPLHRYRTVFLSYAPEDRDGALVHYDRLRALGLDALDETLDPDPAARLAPDLADRIAGSDLFVLYWSNAAARSERIRRETGAAITARRDGDGPDLMPVILDGDRAPRAPADLTRAGFDDPVLWVPAEASA